MASTKDYLDYILDQLQGLDGITYRSMIGEFIIYYQEKIVGGIYDNRFLVKPTESAIALMPDASHVKPYEGAKDMLMVDCIDNGDSLKALIKSMYPELPFPKNRKEQ